MLTATIVVGRYIRLIIVKTFTAAASFVLFSWSAVSTSYCIFVDLLLIESSICSPAEIHVLHFSRLQHFRSSVSPRATRTLTLSIASYTSYSSRRRYLTDCAVHFALSLRTSTLMTYISNSLICSSNCTRT